MCANEVSETGQASESGSGDPLNLFGGVRIGINLQYLMLADSGGNTPLTSTSGDGMYLLEGLEQLIYTLERASLDSSVLPDVAGRKRTLERKYLPEDGDGDDDDDGSGDDDESDQESSTIYLSDEDATELATAANSWFSILGNELAEEVRLSISLDGVLNVEQALDDPSVLFWDESTWESIPQKTRKDLGESCRAFAVECPTASVFLSLRAVEERLGKWYSVETGRDIEDRTFGQVLGELNNTYDESESRPPILSHLEYLKNRRNQVAHPQDVDESSSPGMQEAESTLLMVRETISNIHTRLNEMDSEE